MSHPPINQCHEQDSTPEAESDGWIREVSRFADRLSVFQAIDFILEGLFQRFVFAGDSFCQVPTLT